MKTLKITTALMAASLAIGITGAAHAGETRGTAYADGAESTAEVFSLVQTARANGVDPEKYLAKCIELAVGIKPNDRKEWDRLLPWNLSKEFDLEY